MNEFFKELEKLPQEVRNSELEHAIENGIVPYARELIKAKAVMGEKAVLQAVWSNNIEMVELIIKNGGNVNCVSNSQGFIYTPFIRAVMNRSIPIADLLLKYGAKINFDQSVALFSCMGSDEKSIDMFDFLIKKGIDIHVSAREEPLFFAVSSGFVENVKRLIKAGANVHARNDTIMKEISCNHKQEMVRVLLAAGAKP